MGTGRSGRQAMSLIDSRAPSSSWTTARASPWSIDAPCLRSLSIKRGALRGLRSRGKGMSPLRGENRADRASRTVDLLLPGLPVGLTAWVSAAVTVTYEYLPGAVSGAARSCELLY